MPQYELVDDLVPVGATIATLPPFNDVEDELLNIPGVRAYFDFSTNTIRQGATISDFRLFDAINSTPAKCATTSRPGIGTVGGQAFPAGVFGTAPFTGVTGGTNGALSIPDYPLISNDGYTIAWIMRALAAASDNSYPQASGTLFGELFDNGFQLSIDSSGRMVLEHKQGDGSSFVMRTNTATINFLGNTNVWALRFSRAAATARLYRDSMATVAVENTAVAAAETIATGLIKLASNGASANFAPLLSTRLGGIMFANVALSDTDLARWMAYLTSKL